MGIDDDLMQPPPNRQANSSHPTFPLLAANHHCMTDWPMSVVRNLSLQAAGKRGEPSHIAQPVNPVNPVLLFFFKFPAKPTSLASTAAAHLALYRSLILLIVNRRRRLSTRTSATW